MRPGAFGHPEVPVSSPSTLEKARTPRPRPQSHATAFGKGFLVKLALMAAVNAFGIFIILAALQQDSMGILWVMVGLLVAANWVFFARRTLALKYVFPGLVFLLIFQLFTMGYTLYVSFTNYGQGHNSTKDQAITALLQQNEVRLPDSPAYPLAVVEQGGELGFAVLQEDTVEVGTAEAPLSVVDDAVVTDGAITEVPGWDILDRQAIIAEQQAVVDLRVSIDEDPESGSIRTTDGRTGYVYTSTLEWDAEAGTMTNTETGVVYTPNDDGQFEAEDGSTLNVGWRVNIGLENYTEAFTNPTLAGYFYQITAWTFVQAFLSVALTFLLGLLVAIAMNKPGMRGQKIYRSLLILPYAIPGFISALIFAGLFNTRFGAINQILLGGAEIPWLTDPFLAKFTILFVNLWLGYPYMFLITTGALQALPGDVMEAAKIDGAGPLRTWRSITLPLLLVSTAPLLISSFAFNFNNFTLIYMLTGGGPSFSPTTSLGHTDILISMVYKISGISGGEPTNYGLASALSIMIFVIVGVISAIAFRQTRKLEEVN